MRHVETGAGNIRAIIHVGDFVDRAGVNTHAQLQIEILLVGAA